MTASLTRLTGILGLALVLLAGCGSSGSSRSSSSSGSSGSSGGGTYTAQVRAQLDRATEIVQRDGYRPTHDYEFAAMNDNSTKRFDVQLRSGTAYKLVAACDTDCSDIDMKLYDENGNLVDEDVSSDDIPIVDVSPSWTGAFTVEMRMYTCTTNPCFYGIAVYGKSTK